MSDKSVTATTSGSSRNGVPGRHHGEGLAGGAWLNTKGWCSRDLSGVTIQGHNHCEGCGA
jgi:hypothetical protein